MITRSLYFPAGAALVALALSVQACQKVPLLAPSGSTITLTSLATALPANGRTTIIAQVIEPAGTPPHAGTLVSFSTNLGTVQPAEVETDIAGRATTTFIAGSGSGTATINAISGGVSAGTTGAIKIAIGSAAVASISMSASPVSLPSSGGSSTISATVNDSGGNSLSGVPVTFTTTAGTLNVSVVNTDSSGVARTILTTSRTAEVTATAGVTSVSGTTTTAAPTNKITVAVNLTSTITAGTPTPPVPGVGQTVSIPLTYGSATGASPITRVTVNWGDGSTNTYSGQPAVVSHAYGSAGSYLVTISGTDGSGDSSTTSTNVTVVRSRPSVGITADKDTDFWVNNPTFQFTITATIPGNPTGVAIENIHIDFGDGTSQDLGASSPATARHTYLVTRTGPGDKTVTATATATNGQSGSASMVITLRGS